MKKKTAKTTKTKSSKTKSSKKSMKKVVNTSTKSKTNKKPQTTSKSKQKTKTAATPHSSSKKKSPGAFGVSLNSLFLLRKNPQSFLFIIGIVFLLLSLLSIFIAVGMLAKPIGELTQYEDFLLNDLKPSFQETGDVSEEQGLVLAEIGEDLNNTLFLVGLAIFVFIILYSLFRTLREAAIWKKIFKIKIIRKNIIKLFLVHVFVYVLFTVLLFLFTQLTKMPLLVLLVAYGLILLMEPTLYYFTGKLFFKKLPGKSKHIFEALLLAGFFTRLLRIAVFLVISPLIILCLLLGSAFSVLVLSIIGFILYILREMYMLTLTKELYTKEV